MPLITNIIYIYIHTDKSAHTVQSLQLAADSFHDPYGFVGGSKKGFSMAEQKLFNPETVFFHSRNASVELLHWIFALRKVLSCQIDRFGEKFPRNHCWHRCLPLCPDGCQCLPQWGFFYIWIPDMKKPFVPLALGLHESSQHFLKKSVSQLFCNVPGVLGNG